MTEMNKEIEHLGAKLNIKVLLNYRVEKRVNGKKYHKIVITSDLDNTFKLSNEKVTDDTLERSIENLINLAKDTIGVDKVNNEDLLNNLGFVLK